MNEETSAPPISQEPEASSRERQGVRHQGQDLRAKSNQNRDSLLHTWQRMVQTKDGVFADREIRRAALNLMEDAEHARRAEQKETARRQRAEGAVRASQTRYRSLFDSIDQGFCLIQVLFKEGLPHDYRFLEANPAFETQTGLSNVTGKTMRQLVPAENSNRFQIFSKISLTGETARFEHASDTPGGFYDVCAFQVDEPEKHHVAVLFNDITERKRREANLTFLADIAGDLSGLSSADEIMQSVGAKTGAFLNITACYFAAVDEASGNVTIQQAWGHHGMPGLLQTLRISDCLGEDFLTAGRAGDIFVVRDTSQSTSVDAAVCAEFKVGAFVAVPYHCDGVWTHFFSATHTSPCEWLQGEVELLHELALRISPRLERARAEEALRQSEERNRIALDAAAMAAWDYDVAAGTVLWNEQHFRLLGLEPDRMPKKPADFLEFVVPEDRAKVVEAIRVAVEESGVYLAEFRILRNDAAVRWMSGFGKAIEMKEGHALRLGGVMYDVTERREADEALSKALQATQTAQAAAEAASRAKDHFLAVLSHELRTPLTPAHMAAQMLLDEPGLSEDARDSLDIIRRNILLEGNLVDDLLDLTRIVRGGIQLKSDLVDLHESITHAVAICKVDMESKNHHLEIALDAAEHCVLGDFTRLQQVVWNLLKNACKFTPAVGRIHLRTCNENDSIIMEVTDTGIGLEAEALSQIFESFTQANASITRRFGGLGLGLAISKATVEGHLGQIWAESEGPGKGCTFKVSLPLARQN